MSATRGGLVDSHCHLDMLSDDDAVVADIIHRAKAVGVQHFLNISVNLADFPRVLSIAEQFPEVSASLGLHPNDSDEAIDVDGLVALGQHRKIVGIGETGLDYFRSTGDLSWQRDLFRVHIQAAKILKKPLIIHTREAKADTLAILKEEGASAIGGVMHCFTEDWETAKAAIDLGFYISISGIVTFKNATVIQDTAKQVPLDRLLVETDSPYLAPVPHRGATNEPAFVKYTAEAIAAMRGVSFEALAEATTNNFFTLFKGANASHV